MPIEDTAAIPTPSQVAQNEIAKQAVMLVFGLATAVILMKLQSRMMQQMMQAQRDPDAARVQRMEDAKRAYVMWSKAATWIGNVGVWAWRQADKARASYERDRA